MPKQSYYPSRKNDQAVWLENFIQKAPGITTPLGLLPAKVDAAVASAKWVHYVINQWIVAVRVFSQAATGAENASTDGKGSSVVVLPTFTAPTPPTGTVPVLPGALPRIFDLVREIKESDGYTEAIGQDLQIIAHEDATAHPVPGIKLKLLDGESGSGQYVKLHVVKFGHDGVVLECRRNGGAWESLGIVMRSPFLDKRALLVAGEAEMREYRARFYDKGAVNGDWSPLIKIAVGV